MRKILDTCKQKGIYVMVDETYVEFDTDMDAITSIPLTEYYNNLIILRGTSKFFAAPGLRLGYAVCGNGDLVKEIVKRQNPWTISSLAAIAGEIMFTDQDYMNKTRVLINTERDRILAKLRTCPFIKVFPAHANFVLFKILRDDVTSEKLFDIAIRKGLMIRDCSNFPFLDNRYIRFCFMSPEKNDELVDALLETLNKH